LLYSYYLFYTSKYNIRCIYNIYLLLWGFDSSATCGVRVGCTIIPCICVLWRTLVARLAIYMPSWLSCLLHVYKRTHETTSKVQSYHTMLIGNSNHNKNAKATKFQDPSHFQ
jgi:hypothetical protein